MNNWGGAQNPEGATDTVTIMVLWRLLGAVGRTLITSGVLILLFVAYQLWGTGLQAASAQGALTNEFEELFAEAGLAEAAFEDIEIIESAATPVPATTAPGAPTATPAPPTPTPTPRPKAQIPPELLYQDEGDVMARILIDSINVDWNVVAGTGVDPLRRGPGHYSTTVLPGQPGNSSIAGHRTTYGAPFHRVDELNPGDEIKVQTLQGVAVYTVDAHEDAGGQQVGHFIVDPSATWVLGDFEDNRLTLTACHPKYSAAKRIIVTATLVSEPFDLVPRPGGDLGDAELQGDENPTIEDGSDGSERALDEIISEDVAVDADPSVGFDSEGNVVPVEELTDEERQAAIDAGAELDAVDAAAADEAQTMRSSAAADEEAAAGSSTSSDETDELSEPAAAEEDFGEGLNGDSAAIVPSVTWGIAAAFIWLAAWFVGKRWQKWPAYVLGIVPFALTLWLAFVHIDQAIPSY